MKNPESWLPSKNGSETPVSKEREVQKSIPELINMESVEFRKKYEEILLKQEKVFPNAKHGMDSFENFQEAWTHAEETDRLLVQELATIFCVDIPNNKNKVNGNKLWNHQEVIIFEIMQNILEDGVESVLIHEATGTGKTRMMGVILWALGRLIQRGLIPSNILVLIKRKALALQQGSGIAEAHKRVISKELSTTRLAELKEQTTYMNEQTPYRKNPFFPFPTWKNLSEKNYSSPNEAKQVIIASLQERKVWDAFCCYPHYEELLEDFAKLLSQHAVLMYGASKKDKILLSISPIPPEEEAGSDYFFGLPQEWLNDGTIYVHNEYLGDDISVESVNKARIAMMPTSLLYQDAHRARRAEFLDNVGHAFVDETGLNSDMNYRNMISPENGDDMRIFAATAFNRGGMIHADSYVDEYTVEQAIKDGVLKPHRGRVFPSDTEKLFPSGSYEAAEQLIDEIGKYLEVVPENQKQPLDGPVLVIVSKDLVPYVTQRLMMEYGNPISVLSCDANREAKFAGRLQVRMNDAHNPQTILVSDMSSVIDSYDWRYLQATFIGTQENSREMETIIRAFGRQFHTREDGGFLFQERFSNLHTINRIFWNAYKLDAGIPESGSFSLVPGQYVIGEKECKKERKILHNFAGEPFKNGYTKTELEALHAFSGSFPNKISEQRENAKTVTLRIPPLSHKNAPITKEYVSRFAQINNLIEQEAVLRRVVHGAGENQRDQFAALRETAQKLLHSSVTTIARMARERAGLDTENLAITLPEENDVSVALWFDKQRAREESLRRFLNSRNGKKGVREEKSKYFDRACAMFDDAWKRMNEKYPENAHIKIKQQRCESFIEILEVELQIRGEEAAKNEAEELIQIAWRTIKDKVYTEQDLEEMTPEPEAEPIAMEETEEIANPA